MKRSQRRPEQVAEALRAVIAEALVREVRDPRVGLVTVTGVRVTSDLSHARVAVTVGAEADEDRRREVLEGLEQASGFLRTKAAKALSTRTVPELHFELDRGLERAHRVDTILESLRREGELD